MADDRAALLERAQLLQKAKMIQAQKVTPPDQPIDIGETANAAGTGAVNSAMFGYLPQATGAVKAVMGDDYSKARDAEVSREADLQKKHPYATAAGSLAGAIAVPIPGMAELQAAKEAGILTKLAVGAGKGAAIGALANPGDQPGSDDHLQLAERGKNALTGGALGTAGEGLIQGIEKAPETLQSIRRWMTAKQLGANTGQVKKLLQEAGDGTKLDQLEKYLDDNGMLGVGSNYSTVVDKTNQLKDKNGKVISDIYERAPGKVDAPVLAADFVEQNADRLNKTHGGPQVLEKLKRDLGITDPNADLFDQVVTPKKGLSALGNDASAKDLHDYRVSVDDQIPWGATSEQKLGARENKGLRNYLNDKLQETVTPEDLPSLREANQNYHLAATANNIANQTKAREMSKHILGVMGGVGGIGAATYSHEHGDNWGQAALKGLAAGAAVRGGGILLPAMAYRGAKLATPAAQGLAQYLEEHPEAKQRLLQGGLLPYLTEENK